MSPYPLTPGRWAAALTPWTSPGRIPLTSEPTDAQRHLWNLACLAARFPFPVRSALDWQRALLWEHLAKIDRLWWSVPDDPLGDRRAWFADFLGPHLIDPATPAALIRGLA